jgi:hypothetical protein
MKLAFQNVTKGIVKKIKCNLFKVVGKNNSCHCKLWSWLVNNVTKSWERWLLKITKGGGIFHMLIVLPLVAPQHNGEHQHDHNNHNEKLTHAKKCKG